MNAAKELIQNNLVNYEVPCNAINVYAQKPRIIKDKVPKTIWERAEKDSNHFRALQAKIDQRVVPMVGDYVWVDGERERITVLYPDGAFQSAKDGSGGVHLQRNGQAVYSGTCGYVREGKLVTAEAHYLGSCWIFSEHTPGHHRAVWGSLYFKVWLVEL